MTLAFEVEALEVLKDPKAVFEDAHRWSTYVGVISNQMAYQIVNYLRDNGIYNEDFFSRADKEKSLKQISRRTDTERHVFIGISAEDERIAEEAGWEYLSVQRAAEKADWAITTESDIVQQEASK